MAAAADLQGSIVDAAMDRPLGGVMLHLSPLDGRPPAYTAYSDSGGGFDFKNLAPGSWRLRAEALGYVPWRQVVRVGTAPSPLQLRLQPRPLVMDAVVVQARRQGDEGHSPAFVEHIPLEQAGPMADLARVLDQATGVNIRRYGGLGSFSTVSIRGSTAEQVRVLLDGVPLNRAGGGGVDLGSIPLGGIQSIEVYRGAVPARFGGNSIGGVVHIRTRSLSGARQRGLRLGLGSFGERQLGLSAAGPWKGWEYLGVAELHASANDFRFWDDNGTQYNRFDDAWARRRNSDYSSFRGLVKAGRPLGTGRLQLHNTADLIHKGIPGIGNNQSLHTRYDTWRNLSEALLYGPLGAGRMGYRLRGYYAFERDEYKNPLGEVGTGVQHERNTHRATGLRAEFNALLPAGGLLNAFIGGRREQYSPEDRLRPTDRLPQSRRYGLEGGGEAELRLGRRLIFNIGGQIERLDDRLFDRQDFGSGIQLPVHTRDETLWSARAGVALDVGGGWTLKAHRGRYGRGPSFFELFGNRGAIRGNTDLKSEVGHNWDAGLVFRRRQQDSKAALELAELVCYRNRVDDLIRFEQNSQQVSRPQNFGRALMDGLETRGRVRLHAALSIEGNYVYQRAQNRSPFAFEKGNDLPNAPRHRLGGRIDLAPRHLAFHYAFSRESRHFLDRANLRPVPVRQIHSLGGEAPLKEGLRLSWEVRNLTDNQVADLWGYPLPGRSYALALAYRFSAAPP